MSRETDEWLNRYCLIGCTDERGYAWHHRKSAQGAEPNHYNGFIPLEDVERRLYNFEFVESPQCYVVEGEIEGAITSYGRDGKRWSVVASTEGRKGMLTSDTHEDLGSFKGGYQGHQFREWLIETVAKMLSKNGHELGIASAGLLRKRALSWVSIELPDNITTPEGVEFRPMILGTTSFDGSSATIFKGCSTFVVCDNTRDMALGESGHVYKLKHTKHSQLKLSDARDALKIVFTMSNDFADEIAQLTAWKVSEHDFENLLDAIVPLPEEAGRSKTMAGNKRDQIITLYRSDERAAPWKGTAFGVLQAFNTWNQHYSMVKGDSPRIVRNMENVLNGRMGQSDTEVLDALRVLTV